MLAYCENNVGLPPCEQGRRVRSDRRLVHSHLRPSPAQAFLSASSKRLPPSIAAKRRYLVHRARRWSAFPTASTLLPRTRARAAISVPAETSSNALVWVQVLSRTGESRA